MNRARRWWAGTGCLTRCAEGHTYRPGCLLWRRRRALEVLAAVYRWIVRAVVRWLIVRLTRWLADHPPVKAEEPARVPLSRLATMGGTTSGIHVDVSPVGASAEEIAARHLRGLHWERPSR